MRQKVTVVVIGLIAFAVVIISLLFVREEPGPEILPFTESWEEAVPHQEIPDGLTSISAESCGVCHQDHYAEWKLSTHAHAWTDMQFQAELKKESSPYMCINCHIPLQNQQEYIVDGLIDGDIYNPSRRKNPNWDRKLQQEGITCAACHVRDGAVIGPTGTSNPPHKTVWDPNHLSENLCISCHNAVATITPELACSFETGDEWRQGQHATGKNCIDCHMEQTHRSIAFGLPDRPSRYHSFPGSGIPKVDSVKTNMLNGLDFHPGELAKYFSTGDSIQYTFEVENAHAGHRVPTGDPERFILIKFEVLNAKNEVVWDQTERIGEKWQWYPEAKKLSDNNLMPKENRAYEMVISELPKGRYKLEVKVSKHRMDEKTAEYNKLSSAYPLYIDIYEKSYSFTVR